VVLAPPCLPELLRARLQVSSFTHLKKPAVM
jgi:hypothetical protein